MWHSTHNIQVTLAARVEEFTPSTGPARTLAVLRIGDPQTLEMCMSWAELTDLSDAINTAIIKHAKDVTVPTIVTEELFDAELG